MKTKFKIGLIVITILLATTGCTKYIQEEEGGYVKSETTGQRMTANILCRPKTEESIQIYEANDVDISALPECEDFTITTGGYEGLWESIFVKPLAALILYITKVVGNAGLALMITGIIIRFIVLPITKKTALQSEMLKKAKPELDKLEKKYKDKTEKEDKMKKSQEMMAIYKKNKINPASGCIYAFLQMPILFAFIEAINRVPAIFEESFLGFQLGTTPWVALSDGGYHYIILVVLLVGATYLSFKLNATAGGTGDQAKQMKLMSNMMIIFIAFMSFTLSTAISIYWITSSSFTIIQNLIIKKRAEKNE